MNDEISVEDRAILKAWFDRVNENSNTSDQLLCFWRDKGMSFCDEGGLKKCEKIFGHLEYPYCPVGKLGLLKVMGIIRDLIKEDPADPATWPVESFPVPPVTENGYCNHSCPVWEDGEPYGTRHFCSIGKAISSEHWLENKPGPECKRGGGK